MKLPTTTPAPTAEAKPNLELPEEQSRTFLADFLGQAPVETEKKAAAAPAPEPNPEPEPEAKQPEPKKKGKKSDEPPAPAAPTAEEIAASVGRAVAREMRQNQPEPEKKPVIVVEDDVPATEHRLQSNLETLAKLYPEEYGQIHVQRKQFVDRLRSYEKQWLADHPGETFDPNSEEHNDFYETDPMKSVSNEHLAEAIAERRIAEKTRELEQKIERTEQVRRTEPVAATTGKQTAENIVKELAGDLDIKLTSNGSIDPTSYQAALEADPIKAPIIAGAAEAAHRLAAEVVKIYNGAVTPDPEKNPQHRSLLEFGASMERRMAQLKPSEWSDPKGRALEDFVPSDTYWNRMTPAQRRNHWTFDQDDMVALIAADIRNDAKRAISAEEERVNTIIAKRSGGVASATKSSAQSGRETQQNTNTATIKPTSPSGRGEPNMAGVKGGRPDMVKNSEESWLKSFLGKT